ncbi:MAG: phenylalanine--tRNA ligase subunit beta [Bacteroidota bacterium]
MKISHQWLRTLVPVMLSPEKLAEGLSMLGLEIERFEDQGKRLDGFVVGEVRSVEKHPNADKLTVCQVAVGTQTLQVVCGAPNVASGQKVVVGLEGATVPRDQHATGGPPFVLRRAKIRGVESQGMICSEYELEMGDDRNGIMILHSSAKPGTPHARHFGRSDVIYDVEITANRGDWLSHMGVAREVAALTGKKAAIPAVKLRESREHVSKHASVILGDKHGCQRYVALVFRNVRIGPSPMWLQNRLMSVGVRPINNVVDATNSVMLETGQPLHAFDNDKVGGHSIVVRGAKDGEAFTTLDGKTRTLKAGSLLICDNQRPIAIAGIMGGLNSEISDVTTNVLLESAWFDPVSIRRTSRYLGLSTDASQRFERSVDIDTCLYAAQRAGGLFQELTGAEVLKGAIDVYPKKRKQTLLKARISKINAILGTNLSVTRVSALLGRLGLEVQSSTADSVSLRIPSYRRDLIQEIDLVEEVARMYGYNNIDTETSARIGYAARADAGPEDDVRNFLVGGGFNEIVVNSLQKRSLALLGEEQPVEVLNPVSVDMEMLRTSLIPGALEVLEHNFNRGAKGMRLFECGKVFWRVAGGSEDALEDYKEEQRLLLVLTGDHFNRHHSEKQRKYDILDLKGEVEGLLAKFFLDKCRLIPYDNGKPLSVDNISIEIQGTYAGFLGRLRKEIGAKFGIEEEVLVAELSVDVLSSFWNKDRKFRSLNRFPSVTRDLAFVVAANVPQGNVEQAIREAGGELLSGVFLFDLYSGEQVGVGNKSLAYALEFQPADRTLTDEEVNGIVSKIIRHVQSACGASVRG